MRKAASSTGLRRAREAVRESARRLSVDRAKSARDRGSRPSIVPAPGPRKQGGSLPCVRSPLFRGSAPRERDRPQSDEEAHEKAARSLLSRGPVMNNHFFLFKRVYYGTLRVTRKRLTEVGLTAARYDMLHTLVIGGRGRSPMTGKNSNRQGELQRKLGVTKSVVSRMLKALEKLGFVRRQRCADRRQRLVELTDLGLERVRAAYRAISRAARRLLCHALTCDGKPDYQGFLLGRLCNLEDQLMELKSFFGDKSAEVLYIWHPDD